MFYCYKLFLIIKRLIKKFKIYIDKLIKLHLYFVTISILDYYMYVVELLISELTTYKMSYLFIEFIYKFISIVITSFCMQFIKFLNIQNKLEIKISFASYLKI